MNEVKFRIRKETEAAAVLMEALKAEHEDDLTLLTDSVEGETGLLEAIDAVLAEMDEAEALIAGLREKEHQFCQRRRAMEDRTKRFRALIEQAMAISDQHTLRRSSATLTLRKLPPDVIVLAEADIPSEFYVPQPPPAPKLDKAALKEALQNRLKRIEAARAVKEPADRAAALAGIQEIPGATLNNGGFSLQVRRS